MVFNMLVPMLIGLLSQFSFGAASFLMNSGCSIDSRQLNPAPIVVSAETYKFLYPQVGECSVKLKVDDKIYISCPGSQIVIESITQKDSYIKATCISDTRFSTEEGVQIDFNEIKCSQKPASKVVITPVDGSDNVQIDVGFDISRSIFSKQFHILFNNGPLKTPVYSHQTLTKFIGCRENVTSPRSFIIDDKIYRKLKLPESYKTDKQRATINDLLGLAPDDKTYLRDDNLLSRGHLTPKGDFIYAPQQIATSRYINTAPQWDQFNEGNWKQAEIDVRDYVKNNKLDLEVYTGPYGITTLPNKETGEETELYLIVGPSIKALPVPELFWKIVHDPVNKKGVALLGVNNPYHKGEVKPICKNVASQITWLNWKADDRERGISYACEVNDFKKHIPELKDLEILVSNGLLQNIIGNTKLTKIQPNGFKGLQSLRELDLSATAIESLPVAGLGELESLRIEDTPTMKVIPSIYDLEHLQLARLTHPFHCCAFKYPEQHDPQRHAQYQEKIKKACKEKSFVTDTGQTIQRRRRKRWFQDYYDSNGLGYENIDTLPLPPKDWTPNLEHFKGHPNRSDHSHLNPLRGETIDHEEARPMEIQEDFGTFHAKSAEIPEQHSVLAICGNLAIRTPSVKCFPEANALNPCEDIMGFSWLRISVWFVIVLAVVGNLAVIVVLLFSGGELSVNRFLMCNLAFADFCMGLYLLLIASMDLHSVGTYFNFAFDWQYGFGCKLAGFLTVFACHLSIYTLTVITLERWFAITYAIHLTRRIRLGAATKAMLCGWIYSIFVASLPLAGVSNYSSTSICLPMEINRVADRAYLYSIIIINGIAFALIVFCYAQIYMSLGQETRHEKAIAKKFALLIFTDFATWAPIAFFSLTALAGYPLIGVTKSKILLVFFYPINSCANPYLYAIMTAQYRKDFFVLLSRCGLFKHKAQRYTLTTSLNNSHPHPLLARSNGHCQIFKSNHIDDTLI